MCKKPMIYLISFVLLASLVSNALAAVPQPVSYKAYNPSPADGAEDIRPDVPLSWTPGVGEPSHDVYFGTDFNDVNNADTTTPNVYKGGQDANSYDPGTLQLGETYYWRIDEVQRPVIFGESQKVSATASIVKGDVWRFTIVRTDNFYTWPMFHRDQQRTGVSGGGIVTTPATLLWTFPAVPTPQELPSSPVISLDRTIYFGSTQPTGGPCPINCPKVYAIWPWGVLRWSQCTTLWGKITTAGAINPSGSRIYFCTHESSGIRANVFAIDTVNGGKLWTGTGPNMDPTNQGLILPDYDWVGSSNPVVIDEAGTPVIYVCGNGQYAGKYRLYRIVDNGNTASIAWIIELPMPTTTFGMVSPSPAVAEDGTIYVGAKGDPSIPKDGALYAINPTGAGSIQWFIEVATTPAEAALSPAIKEEGGKERIYIGTTDYRMCAVKENAAQNGGTLARNPPYTNSFNQPVTTCPAIADLDADGRIEVVFASSSTINGHVYALTDLGSTYSVLWGLITIGPTLSSPVVGWRPVAPPHQCTIFIGDAMPGKIYSLAGWNGSILDQYPTGMMLSSPSLRPYTGVYLGSAGWVFATSNSGHLYAFGPPFPEFNIADINEDGCVDVLDFAIMVENWEKCRTIDPNDTYFPVMPGDINEDGCVDVLDFLVMVENWGKCSDTIDPNSILTPSLR